MRTTIITENVKHDFTPLEFQNLGMRLAEATQKVDDLTQTKKQIVKDYDAQLEAQNADVLVLSRKLTNGYEMVRTDCWVRYHDPIQGQKTIVRKDTGEVVRIEQMNPVECQEVLFEEPAAEPPAVPESMELATLNGAAPVLNSETFRFSGKTVNIALTVYQAENGWHYRFTVSNKVKGGATQESTSGSDTEKPFEETLVARSQGFAQIEREVSLAWRRGMESATLSKQQIDDARRIVAWAGHYASHPQDANDAGQHPELAAAGD